MSKHSGKTSAPVADKIHKHATGAVRGADVAGEEASGLPYPLFPARFDLLCPRVLLRDARTLGEGAGRYGPHNWWRGMDENNLLNHAIAHILQWMQGDRSDDHLAHARWGLAAIMHFEETQPHLLTLQNAVKGSGFHLTTAQRAALTDEERAGLKSFLDGMHIPTTEEREKFTASVPKPQ